MTISWFAWNNQTVFDSETLAQISNAMCLADSISYKIHQQGISFMVLIGDQY